jgi:hypothetical protein
MSTNQTPEELPLTQYWVEVWEYLTRYLPNGESEEQKLRIDAIEDEMYESLPKKYKDPFMGAYHIAKMLSI